MHSMYHKNVRTAITNLLAVTTVSLIAMSSIVAKEPLPPQPPEKLLNLVPANAQVAVVLSGVDRLKKRMSDFEKQAGIPEDFLQITHYIVDWLDAKKPLDPKHPVAAVALLNDIPHDRPQIDNVLLLAPVKPGTQLNAADVQVLVAPMGAVGGDIVQQRNYAILPMFVTGKFPPPTIGKNTLQGLVTPALAEQLNAADVLVFLNPQKLDGRNEAKFDELRKKTEDWPEVRLRALGMRMVEDMSNIQHTFFTLDLSNGLKAQFSALLRNPDDTPPFIVERLKRSSGKHPPHYRGLPDMPLLGATSIGDTATRNTEILTVLNRLEFIDLDHFMRDVFAIRTDDSVASNLLEFLTTASKRSNGARAAVYEDHSVAIIFDTSNPEEVVASIQEVIGSEPLSQAFEYVPNTHEIGRIQVDSIRLKRKDVPDNASPTAKAIAEVARNGLLIAQVGEHVVMTSEPVPKVMEATIANLQGDKPGLATKLTPPHRTKGQVDLIDVRFHASQIVGLFSRRVLERKDVAAEDAEFSRLRIQATEQELTTEIDITREEFLQSIKQALAK